MVRVLVVDDSPTVRMLLVRILGEDPEIEVVGQAGNGKEAVEMAERLTPDLITMDVAMPDMDGLEATRKIMTKNPIPILFVTAHAASKGLNVVFEAMKAGALDVAAKPVDFEDKETGNWNRGLVDKVKTLATVKLQGR